MAPSPLRDPIEYSPTTSSFLSSTSNAITSGSVRRNLFSTHLSRRPASGAQPTQLDGQNDTPDSPSQTQAQPPPPPQQQQQQQQQYGSQLPRLRSHQRSVSTPSLSPSPPRSSPFHNVLDGGSSAAFIPPPIPQLSPPHRAVAADRYDPTISPNRPLSPHSSAALFPNQSIIALNPVTGRPVLPKLPVLPSRLRLTDSDDETNEGQGGGGADDDDEDVQVHHTHNAAGEGFSDDDDDDDDDDDGFHHESTVQASSRRAGHRARQHQHLNGPPHPSSVAGTRTTHTHTHAHAHTHGHAHTHTHTHTHMDAQAAAVAAARAQAEAVALDELDSERRDRERIERLLREMMSRQRARAKGKSAASSTVAGAADEDDDDDDDDEEEDEAQAEKEELMGLIMGSLRREVGRAEDEAWMFGESLGMGAMVGRDEVGVYD
ncbi:hypothetical protein CLCR_02967 [Cladophialophora carrionii]|uniref:Uncharacterized protein n=1 Tax=Cladophialophora carrionii TaxID=86049 RepID=A0A1C1D1S6_9EURO|nr:hypothetical protein CLCR_02967 [Cladophialophora carrionii]